MSFVVDRIRNRLSKECKRKIFIIQCFQSQESDKSSYLHTSHHNFTGSELPSVPTTRATRQILLCVSGIICKDISLCRSIKKHKPVFYRISSINVRPSDRPFVRPWIRPSVCPWIRPSVRPSVRPSIRPSVRLSIHASV